MTWEEGRRSDREATEKGIAEWEARLAARDEVEGGQPCRAGVEGGRRRGGHGQAGCRALVWGTGEPPLLGRRAGSERGNADRRLEIGILYPGKCW